MIRSHCVLEIRASRHRGHAVCFEASLHKLLLVLLQMKGSLCRELGSSAESGDQRPGPCPIRWPFACLTLESNLLSHAVTVPEVSLCLSLQWAQCRKKTEPLVLPASFVVLLPPPPGSCLMHVPFCAVEGGCADINKLCISIHFLLVCLWNCGLSTDPRGKCVFRHVLPLATGIEVLMNHRITERLGLGGTLKIIQFQPPRHEAQNDLKRHEVGRN